MFKAFLFDNGGVMTDGGTPNDQSKHLAVNLNIDESEATDLLRIVWRDYLRGKITEVELWQIVENKYGKLISLDKRDIWNKWDNMYLRPEMSKLVNDLRKAGYKIGMLSNVIPNTEKEIRENGGYDLFDFLVLSCIVGYAKPEIKIYKIAMKNLVGIKPEEVVFLDDQSVCLGPARSMSMKTILVSSAAQAINDVKKLVNL